MVRDTGQIKISEVRTIKVVWNIGRTLENVSRKTIKTDKGEEDVLGE